MTTLRLRKSIGRSPLRVAFLLIPLVLTCFALSPTARAHRARHQTEAIPTATRLRATDALFSLTTGTDNTAIGFDALFGNTTGSDNTANGEACSLTTPPASNTATGFGALASNTTGGNTANGFIALEATQPATTTRPTVFKRFISTNHRQQHGQRSSCALF